MMDRLIATYETEREIVAVMRELGINRADAERFVAARRADLTNDIVFDPPLTEDERRKLGLGKTIREVMAELGELDDTDR